MAQQTRLRVAIVVIVAALVVVLLALLCGKQSASAVKTAPHQGAKAGQSAVPAQGTVPQVVVPAVVPPVSAPQASPAVPELDRAEYLRRVRAMLSRHEGRIRHTYPDPGGGWAVGVGHHLGYDAAAPEVVRYRERISEAQIDVFLTDDIERTERVLNDVFGGESWYQQLSQVRRAALIDLAFGPQGKIASFVNMRSALARGDFETAAQEIENSRWAVSVKEHRTGDTAGMMRSNSWAEPERR